MKNMTFKKITSQRLFLPIFCLALVLLVNFVTTPNFFAIEVRNGVLYGYLIDIINRASELVILAVGMTLVVCHFLFLQQSAAGYSGVDFTSPSMRSNRQ